MKKIILFLSVILLAFAVQAQTGKRMTFTPTTNDSIVGAATKYCTLSGPITGQWNASIEVYITPSISSSDSTHVWVEGSMNGTQWYKLINLGEPARSVGTYYTTNATVATAGYDYKGRMGTSAAGWLMAASMVHLPALCASRCATFQGCYICQNYKGLHISLNAK